MIRYEVVRCRRSSMRRFRLSRMLGLERRTAQGIDHFHAIHEVLDQQYYVAKVRSWPRFTWWIVRQARRGRFLHGPDFATGYTGGRW